MKKFICFVVLGLLLGVALTQEPCLTIKRRDTLEKWVAFKDSPLCNVFRKYDKEHRYGFSVKDGQFNITKPDGMIGLGKAYVTEKTDKDVFSFGVYRPDLNFSHFLTIEETADSSKWQTILYEDSDNTVANAHIRTTHFIRERELVRQNKYHKIVMIYGLVIVQGILAIASLIWKVSKFGTVFNTFLLVLTSVLTATWWIDSFLWFCILMGCILALSIGLGIVGTKLPSAACTAVGAVMIFYYFFGGAFENRWFFAFAAFILGCLGLLFGLLKTHADFLNRLGLGLQLAVFWIQIYQFWSYIFRIYPPEIFFRFMVGPKDYRTGVSGRGATLWYPSLIVLVAVAIIAAISGILNKRRDDRSHSLLHHK